MTTKQTLPPETAGEMVRMAREFLARKGVVEARLEAELLVAHALGLDRLGLFMQLDRPLAAREIDAARDLLVRRGKREPVAYITGSREFYARSFKVGPGVLIPRPETELIVDLARERARMRAGSRLRIADVGTGSGCIAITIALEIEDADVVAIDVSAAAILCARANADALGARIELCEGDAFAVLAVETEKHGPFDLITCNPPYVRAEDRATLAPEVREHEPAIALYSPPGDPDHWVRRLLAEGREHLAIDGALLVELDSGQSARARALAEAHGYSARLLRDLAGIERTLDAERMPGS